MSYALNDLTSCEAVQENLENHFDNIKSESLPLTQIMNAPGNATPLLEQKLVNENNKTRDIRVVYQKRLLLSEVSETLTSDCEGDFIGDTSKLYVLGDSGVEKKAQYSITQLLAGCKSNDDYFNNLVRIMLDGARRKLEYKFQAQLVAKLGKFATGDTEGVNVARTMKTIATRKATSGNIDENGIAEILYSASEANFMGLPIIVGSGEIQKYVEKLYAGCCADHGLNIAEFSGGKFMFLKSKTIASLLGGTNDFLLLDAASIFMLQHNENKGMVGFNELNLPGTQQGVIVDPMTLTEMNYGFHYQTCGKKATVYVSTNAHLETWPDDMYQSGDDQYGVNGTLHFRITNPA